MRARLISLVGLLLCVPVLALAAKPDGPPGKNKLPAPEGLVCPVVDTDVVVSWDLVADANAYQVEWSGITTAGAVESESEFVDAPPVLIALDAFASLTVHVRALPGPKHEGGPPQGGGPKGIWSGPCVVEIPVPAP